MIDKLAEAKMIMEKRGYLVTALRTWSAEGGGTVFYGEWLGGSIPGHTITLTEPTTVEDWQNQLILLCEDDPGWPDDTRYYRCKLEEVK